MAKLIIQRNSEFNNRFRGYGIYIDGVKVGTISNGQAEEYVVAPGEHKIIAKVDWCSSPERTFTVRDNEKKYFRVAGFKLGKWLAPLAVLILVAGYILKKTYHFYYTYYLVIPLLVVLLYYISFVRKNYLRLEESEGIL